MNNITLRNIPKLLIDFKTKILWKYTIEQNITYYMILNI